MSNPTVGQAILAMIESDLAATGGAPVLQFLEDCKAANGNRALQAVALLKLEAALPAAGIQLEIQVEAQMINLAISWLQSYITSKGPAAAPAAAA